MIRRAARRAPRRTAPAAALLAAVLLLAACGGAGEAPAGQAPSGRTEAPAGEQRPAVDQSTPGQAAASYFTAVGDARFGDACGVLAPVARARYASAGQDCQTELSDLFDEATRKAIGRVAADDAAVEVTGDTAMIPGTALSRTDLPDGAERPSFPTVRASRQDGLWYLVL